GCQRNGVKPILGASLTVRAPAPPPRDAHVVLVAEDDTGYANLCRLLTDAQLLGERGDPWVAVEQICAHAAGMTVLLGPRSHPGQLAVAGRADAAARQAAPFREAFGYRCVVAVEHRLEAGSAAEIRRMLRFAEKLDAVAVATNPVRYLVPDDAFLADALSRIRQMGYAAYFLTVGEIVADVKAMGIMAACRGSAAGSLVCYLIGISDVDALRHDLAFERFLNPMRDELPDVDIDVESARREDVYDMILSRHGQERAACVAMIDTFRARAAIREVGKALGLPEVEVGMVANA